MDVDMEKQNNGKTGNQNKSQQNEDGDWNFKFCPYQTNLNFNLQKHWTVTSHNFYEG